MEDGKNLDLAKPLNEQIEFNQIKLPDLYLTTDLRNLQEFLEQLYSRRFNDQKERRRMEEANMKREEEEIKMEEERKIKKQKQEKSVQEAPLVSELSKNLTDPIIFRRVIGRDVNEIMACAELQMPPPHNFQELELSELEEMIKLFNRKQRKHYVDCESGTHEQVSDIIEFAINFIDKAHLKKEYTIKPFLEFQTYGSGIERRVDSIVFKEFPNQIICLTGMKHSAEDVGKGIMQNADQLRSFCLCNNKKTASGIASNGVYWYFTKYEIMEVGQKDKFLVSNRFTVLKLREDSLNYFEMGNGAVKFFGVLRSFIEMNII